MSGPGCHGVLHGDRARPSLNDIRVGPYELTYDEIRQFSISKALRYLLYCTLALDHFGTLTLVYQANSYIASTYLLIILLIKIIVIDANANARIYTSKYSTCTKY